MKRHGAHYGMRLLLQTEWCGSSCLLEEWASHACPARLATLLLFFMVCDGDGLGSGCLGGMSGPNRAHRRCQCVAYRRWKLPAAQGWLLVCVRWRVRVCRRRL